MTLHLSRRKGDIYNIPFFVIFFYNSLKQTSTINYLNYKVFLTFFIVKGLMSVSKYNKRKISNLDRTFKINLINSITGLKPANLIGSTCKGSDNVAIFSSVIHLGSSPALIGFMIRPQYKKKTDTYLNLLENPYFTINSIQMEDIDKAHKSSTKFARDISEFDELNIEKIYIDDYKAPFVKDSLIKIGLHKVEEIKLLNRCRLIVGKVELVVINNSILESDGNIDFSKSTTTCISGCQNYYNVKLAKQKKRVK